MRHTNGVDLQFFFEQLPRGTKVEFIRHDEAPSWWRFVLRLFSFLKLRQRWVTVGRRIFYPKRVPSYACLRDERAENQWMTERLQIIAHELEHVKQWLRLGRVRFMLLYFVFPLPIFFSGRYWLERQAFLVDVRYFNASMGNVARDLCGRQYMWAWKLKWAYAWFVENTRRV